VRRWNGWGDEAISVPLGPDALSFLERALGPGQPRPDASLEANRKFLPRFFPEA